MRKFLGTIFIIACAFAIFHRWLFVFFNQKSWEGFVAPFYSFAWVLHLGWPYDSISNDSISNSNDPTVIFPMLLGAVVCAGCWAVLAGLVVSMGLAIADDWK